MTILALAILAASAVGDEPGSAELVRLLGSADRVEREEAALTLEELGPAALPALRDAANTATGDARSRASSLARRIEGRQLGRSSRSISRISPLRTSSGRSARANCTLRLDAGADAALARRPIVATAKVPVPFWEALDRVGRAGHVRNDPGAAYLEASRVPVLPITHGDPPRSTLYRGPFRVHVVALHRRRHRDLGSGPGHEPNSKDVLQVDHQAFAEPGRFLDFDGPPRFEAEDDHGHRLTSSPSENSWTRPRSPTRQTPGAIAVLQWRIPLEMPDAGGAKTLRRLRGTLPVIVSAARPDPLSIAMKEGPAQSHRIDDTTLQLRILRAVAGPATIEATVARDPDPAARRATPPAELLYHRFDFEDRDGRPLSWLPFPQNAGSADRMQLRFMFSDAQRPTRRDCMTWSGMRRRFRSSSRTSRSPDRRGASSTAAICAVPERAEQQGDVVVLAGSSIRKTTETSG